jgi:quinoprotein glucose dehydrogenase
MAVLVTAACAAEAPVGEWRHYGGDSGSTKYAPLDQIDRSNVGRLQIAWRRPGLDPSFRALDESLIVSPNFRATPLMVDGLLYSPNSIGLVEAFHPGTGETVWTQDPPAPDALGGDSTRGLGYWQGDDSAGRLFVQRGELLTALDPKTGQLYPDFGQNGSVNVRYETEGFSWSGAPQVCRDVVILGSTMSDAPPRREAAPGDVRAYDVRTGALRWTFHVVPREWEAGVETWDEDSWRYTGHANLWTLLSADEELGFAYLPLSSATSDLYGGHRPGDNLYSDSLVAVDCETGERKWHYQITHHDLWDFDLPAAPVLADITVDGREIKAVVQITKQSFAFVFDRVTGEPVWPIEERPVPQTDVPGETTSPTQPFPIKPPPFERQGITEDDLIDFTPALRQEALDYVAQYKMGPLFTPPSLVDEEGKGATIQVPGAAGGANWGSAGVDPETGILYVQSGTVPSLAGLIKPDTSRSKFDFIRGSDWLMPARASGLPLTKPPYGRVTAIDLNKGEILWQVAHGEGPKDHPLLKDLDLPDLGAPSNSFLSNSGCVITKTLVIYSHIEVQPDGTHSPDKWWLIAYDKQTGERVWREKLPAPPFAVPMTYMHAGRQYVAVGVGGAQWPGALLAFALPD